MSMLTLPRYSTPPGAWENPTIPWVDCPESICLKRTIATSDQLQQSIDYLTNAGCEITQPVQIHDVNLDQTQTTQSGECIFSHHGDTTSVVMDCLHTKDIGHQTHVKIDNENNGDGLANFSGIRSIQFIDNGIRYEIDASHFTLKDPLYLISMRHFLVYLVFNKQTNSATYNVIYYPCDENRFSYSREVEDKRLQWILERSTIVTTD